MNISDLPECVAYILRIRSNSLFVILRLKTLSKLISTRCASSIKRLDMWKTFVCHLLIVLNSLVSLLHKRLPTVFGTKRSMKVFCMLVSSNRSLQVAKLYFLILLILILLGLSLFKKRILHNGWVIHRRPPFDRLMISPVRLDIIKHALVKTCIHHIHVLLISNLIAAHCFPPIL